MATVNSNKVRYNLKNVHYAKKTDSGYATPVAIEGAVSLSLSAEGEVYKKYADGKVYFQQAANNGYSGDLTMAMIPDSFRTDILGEIADKNGVLFEDASAIVSDFALGFTIDGDVHNTMYWYYNCTATRPSTEASTTEDSMSTNDETLSISAVSATMTKGIETFEAVRAKSSEVQDDVSLADWFKEVYIYTQTTTSSSSNS